MEHQAGKRPEIQNRIAWPFIAVMILLLIAAPVLTMVRSPYAEYVMPAVFILLVIMFVTVLLYNKVCLGVWLPGRNKDPSG
jgi:lipopolysaccharide export LptBFGC system permease protein LptF